MSANTVEIKPCANPCPFCGGPSYVKADVAASGRWERMYINCLKCGPIQTLSAISPEDARQAEAETQRRLHEG